MKFTKEQVREACERMAPKYKFDPKLIFAVCLQEGAKNSKGHFEPDMARLEQGFYRKYVEDEFELATTSEVLLSASYGIMQLMGESLRQEGFFDWYYNSRSDGMKKVLGNPLSQFAIPNALDAYCTQLDWMIEYGCKHMARKRSKADGDIKKMLGYWNGDLTGKYAEEVLKRYEALK